MKSYILISFFLLCFSHNLFSQKGEEKSKSLEIHVMPLAFYNSSPRFRVGVEYNYGPRFGYSVEIGAVKSFLSKGVVKSWSGGKDYSFFEIRPEIKYYLFKLDDHYSSIYCAAELYLIRKNDLQENGNFYRDDSYILFDEARLHKTKYGIHIKAGIKKLILKRFDIDLYGGAGVGQILVKYSDLIDPYVDVCHKQDEIFVSDEKREGEATKLHFTFGCKIGWVIFQK